MRTFFSWYILFQTCKFQFIAPNFFNGPYSAYRQYSTLQGFGEWGFDDFERQLTSSTGVAGIADRDGHLYLHLHIKGGALAY